MIQKRGATPIPSRHSRLRLVWTVVPPKYVLTALTLCSLAAVVLINLASTKGERPVTQYDAAVTHDALIPSKPIAAAQVVAIADPEESAPPIPEQPWHQQVVRPGDNLSLIFKRAGYSDKTVYKLVHEAADGKALISIYPGQTLQFQNDSDGHLQALRYIKSPLETITYQRSVSGFESTTTVRTPEPHQAWAVATITSSLFEAGQEAGLSQNSIMDLADIFGGVIDFVQDPRKGDTIDVLYQELYLDGKKYRDGDIIAASFTNRGQTFNAYRYQDTNGEINYYNENGVSMRKAFLLAPVDFTRVSSNFNMRRLHPLYKTLRPHRGTDYAAPRGTPVYAAGDGRVIKSGYSRANGNYIFIQHGERYVTKYLHLNKRKVKKGQRVVQRQVIGTVGSTGAATGPHLHYEFLVDGVHRNPRTIHKQLPKAKSLPKSELPRFEQAIAELSLQLAALRSNNQLAMGKEPVAPAQKN